MARTSRTKLLTDLAEIVLAYSIDPSGIGAIAAAGKKAIGLVFSLFDRETGQTLSQIIDRVRTDFELLSDSEGCTQKQIDDGQLDTFDLIVIARS